MRTFSDHQCKESKYTTIHAYFKILNEIKTIFYENWYLITKLVINLTTVMIYWKDQWGNYDAVMMWWVMILSSQLFMVFSCWNESNIYSDQPSDDPDCLYWGIHTITFKENKNVVPVWTLLNMDTREWFTTCTQGIWSDQVVCLSQSPVPEVGFRHAPLECQIVLYNPHSFF